VAEFDENKKWITASWAKGLRRLPFATFYVVL